MERKRGKRKHHCHVLLLHLQVNGTSKNQNDGELSMNVLSTMAEERLDATDPEEWVAPVETSRTFGRGQQ